ncbi:hypothetical protein BC831DRAFT_464959, partial [Entophlyctis helioformis]
TAMAKMDTTDGRCMRTDSPHQCCAAPALLLPKQNSAVASGNTVLTPSRPHALAHSRIHAPTHRAALSGRAVWLLSRPASAAAAVAAASCGGAAPVCAASRTHICLR